VIRAWLPPALPLPHSLAGDRGTIPGWWGPASLGTPHQIPVPQGAINPFSALTSSEKKKQKQNYYEFLWLEAGLRYSNFT